MIPQPHVVERGPVLVDVGLGQLGVTREGPLLNRVERERFPRGVDVVLDERRFAHLFVGRHDEALDGARVELPGQCRQGIDAHGADGVGGAAAHGPRRREAGAHEGRRGFRQREGHPGVDVGVAGAADDAGGREHRVRTVEPRAGGEQHEERRGQEAEMPARASAEPDAEGRDRHLAAEQVERPRAGGGHAHLHEPVRAQQVEHRQCEDVERDVVAEDGIGRAEGLPLLPAEELAPRRGRIERDEYGRAGRDDGAERLHLAAGRQRQRDAFGRRDDLRLDRQRTRRDAQVHREPRERHGERQAAQGGLRAEHGGVGGLMAEFVEPPPVGHHLDERGEHEDREDERGQNGDTEGRTHGVWPVYAPLRPRSRRRSRLSGRTFGAIVAWKTRSRRRMASSSGVGAGVSSS